MLGNVCFMRRRKNKFMVMFVSFFVVIYLFSNDILGATLIRRNIFIDAGADSGAVYSAFHAISSYLPGYSWEIIAIEANPTTINSMPKFPNLTILNKAIWTEDGTILFYLNKRNNAASSLFEKNAEDEPYQVTVESIDFSQWMKKNFTTEDYIILNMDIEEAEYAVLEKMLSDDTAKYIDRLYVEFNNDHLIGNSLRKRKILKRMRKAGVAVQTSSLWGILLVDILGNDVNFQKYNVFQEYNAYLNSDHNRLVIPKPFD